MDDKKLKKLLEDSFRKLFNESFFRVILPQINRLDQKVDRYDKKIDDFKNGVYDRMDAVYKEVLNVRVEQAAHTGAHDRVDETLEDHDKRIKSLESPPATTHSVRRT